MPAAILVLARHSHLYPVNIVSVSDLLRSPVPQATVIEFSDGSGATATIVSRRNAMLERVVDRYVTQKKHTVGPRRRSLQPQHPARAMGRIARRLTSRLLPIAAHASSDRVITGEYALAKYRVLSCA